MNYVKILAQPEKVDFAFHCLLKNIGPFHMTRLVQLLDSCVKNLQILASGIIRLCDQQLPLSPSATAICL